MDSASQILYDEIKEMVCLESEQIFLLEEPLELKTESGFTFTVTMVDYVNGVLRTDHGVMVESYRYHSLVNLRDQIKEQQIRDACLLDEEIDRLNELYDFPQTQQEIDDYHWAKHMEDLEN